jgi:hypothetical protein
MSYLLPVDGFLLCLFVVWLLLLTKYPCEFCRKGRISILEGVDSPPGLWAPGSAFWRVWTALWGCGLPDQCSGGCGWPSGAVGSRINVL